MTGVLGVILILLALLVVIPVGILLSGAAFAAVFSSFLRSAKAKDFEGSELVDLS
jgi:hypothetical protein